MSQELDPKASYDWSEYAEEAFVTLTGNEFGILRQVVEAHLQTPEAQTTLAFANIANILQQKFVEGVESGKVKKVPTKKVKASK